MNKVIIPEGYQPVLGSYLSRCSGFGGLCRTAYQYADLTNAYKNCLFK